MSNDNLKNNVQDELAQLSFQPSENVWPQVKKQLEKEKRKRGIIFFWLLFGLLLTGGFLGYFNTSLKNKTIVTTIKPNNKFENKTENKTEKETISTTTIDKKKITATDVNTIDSFFTKPTIITDNIDETIATAKKRSIKTKSKTLLFVKAPAVEKDFVGKNKITTINSQPESIKDEIVVATPTKDSSLVNEKSMEQFELTKIDTIVITDTKLSMVVKKNNDTILQKSKLVVQKSKIKIPWLFGIDMEVGLSNIGNGFTLGIDGNSEKSVLDNAVYTTAPPLRAAPNTASGFKKGTAFSIGLVAERKINKRFSFITGINYQYLSASILTGQKFDTAITTSQSGAIYRQGSINTYLNKFHFITIPVMLNANVFTKNKFGINVNIGIAVTQLLSTNALLYDTTVKLYYQNKSIFNKTQLVFNAGLLLNYTLNNNVIITAGPQFTHNLTTIGNSYNYSNRYFKVWAVKAKIMLNKKNKMQR